MLEATQCIVKAPGLDGALPRVTVVIPARNEERYIAAALGSVAQQDYPAEKIQCVVVDNASRDDTRKVVSRFALAHPELPIEVLSEPVIGVASAKNRGAGVATGEVIVFLDADSRMAPELLQSVASRYRSGSPAGSIRVVADSGDLLDRGFFALLELGKILFGIRAQMMYCDRQLFASLCGFRPELRLAEDLEFLRRVRTCLRQNGGDNVCHVRESEIATSPRRLREYPYRLGLFVVFFRWALAHGGIGRERDY